MTPQEFIHKWQAVTLSERAACQQHFLDLCELLGQPKPAAADPEGAWYTFERGVQKTDGGQGWADVWMQGHFGWEYKGKHKDLAAAYKQLLQYREDLGNPPLLIVCDMDRFEVHTNFTGTAKKVFAFGLEGLADPATLEVLRKVFTEPEALRPGQTAEAVTREVAEVIGQVADAVRVRGVEAQQAAHFLMKIMFSMFAEDIELLKNKVFSKVLQASAKPGVTNAAERLSKTLRGLFEAMAHGGLFGADEIPWVNGGLFADAEVIDLRVDEIQKLAAVNTKDWSNVEPSVFGTLFERILDPAKRSQIGAHYTSREDILTLLEPVMMQPLRREWAEVKTKCEALVPKIQEESRAKSIGKTSRTKGDEPEFVMRRGVSKKGTKSIREFRTLIDEFHERLTKVTVLDPACGSGNFLYVALNLLLDLEKEVITYASRYLPGMFPEVRPTQLAGIEINTYAHELASVVIWIGYLQWMHHNGFNPPSNPVLEPIESIRRMDAIIDLSNPTLAVEPKWPQADFIVGNPPFLGDKKMRGDLGDDYVSTLRAHYSDRLPAQSDLCCYWFEKALLSIRSYAETRVGLLATQGIRGGANRCVLDRIKEQGNIFWARSDQDWILDGATVHVSMVGFDNGSEESRILDGKIVQEINSNLTTSTDVTKAIRLRESDETAFIGVSMHGPFDLAEPQALSLLKKAGNPTGRTNSDVICPIINAKEVGGIWERRWTVYFPSGMELAEAALFESPFEYVQETVKPVRDANRRRSYRENWWVHGESRPAMLNAICRLPRFIVTPRVGKHRHFVWMTSPILPSDATVAIARSDDSSFGVLNSRPHYRWALSQGTQVRERESGFRYTPSTCFDTFPFPHSTETHREVIADAARDLDRLRKNWLNPLEWTTTEVLEFPGTVGGPWDRYIEPATVREHPSPALPVKGREPEELLRIGTVKYPRVVPRDEACARELKKRTLTNLYNERPTWLELAHRRLDEAVFAAYGWSPEMSDDELLAALLALNLERAAAQEA